MKISTILIAVVLSGCASAVKQNEGSGIAGGEQYRPKYHFTPPAQWMNDPNGMVYYEGEYHLFYQHYPDSNVWGPMHWGHAVSRDMLTWEHLPIALYPDSLGYIFSGSCVIDWENTSGLGSDGNPPMVAIFTYHDPIGAANGSIDYQTQGIAHSLDKGRTWTKYKNNPVLANPGIIDFRDPKVFWHKTDQNWVMILAVLDHVNIYTSSNLTDWSLRSEFGHTIGGHGGVWECPDLFALTDQDGIEKWVMLVSINPGGPQGGSATQYFVGDFDGKTFTPADSVTRWVDHGADNYAGVTWSDVPEEDSRRLFIGWMSNWQYAEAVPTDAWRSAMTLPRELLLQNTTDGYRLQSKPVVEINGLFNEEMAIETSDYTLSKNAFRLRVSDIPVSGMELVFSNQVNEKLIVGIRDEKLIIDRSNAGDASFSKVFAAVHSAPLAGLDVNSIEVFMDQSSVEIFVNQGEVVMTDLLFPSVPFDRLVSTPDLKLKIARLKTNVMVTDNL